MLSIKGSQRIESIDAVRNLSDTSVDLIHRSICLWDLTNGLLAVLYIFLFVWCLQLLKQNRSSWSSGQSWSFLWYLSCTILLCMCRFVGFILVPYAETSNIKDSCKKYQTFQWELDGSADLTSSLSLGLLFLSSASSALFFSSYSYFVHSLSKILDTLTSQPPELDSNSLILKYSLLLILLNVGVWFSIVMLWVFRLGGFRGAEFIDDIAQLSTACASLATCAMFAVHFRRAFLFLGRGDDFDKGRAAQLTGLLKLRRVLGVCRVCTVCFAVRAVLLLRRTTLSPIIEDLYYLLAEASPTIYMLYAFRSSSDGKGSSAEIELGIGALSLDPMQEFEELKQSLMRLGGSREVSQGPGFDYDTNKASIKSKISSKLTKISDFIKNRTGIFGKGRDHGSGNSNDRYSGRYSSGTDYYEGVDHAVLERDRLLPI